jgi:hypothetical protein
MPRKHSFRHAARSRESQDAFIVTRTLNICQYFVLRFIVCVITAGIDHLEKISGRKLLVVAYNNDLLRTRHNPERIFGRNLTGLVDHEKIES